MMDHVAIIVAVVLSIVWREGRLHDERKRRQLADERMIDLRLLLSVERWDRQRERREHAEVLRALRAAQLQLEAGDASK